MTTLRGRNEGLKPAAPGAEEMADAHPQAAPFFIVGCSRSGTTLLQTLIDSQPDFAIPPESHIYVRFGSIFHTYGDLDAKHNRRRLIDDLLSDAYIRRWRLDAVSEDIERRILRNTIAGVIEALFAHYAELQGATRWGDKTPEHIRHLGPIRRDFPGARLIHLVRDGRDVAEAMRRMIFGPVTAVGLAREWRREVMHWQTFCKAAGNAGMLIVNYEKLVTAPQKVVREILEFLNGSYHDTTRSYMESPLSRKLGALGPWQSSLHEGISADKIGIFRQKFTTREVEIFEAIAGDALAAFGYEREHTSPRGPTLFDRQYAFVADRFVRWYRKLHHPRVFWAELQFRIRRAYRLGREVTRRRETHQ